MLRATLLLAAVLLTATLALPAGGLAQVTPHERMQQHMAQMDAMIQRMERVQARMHALDQRIAGQMDRMQNQDQLRVHQQLREMCDATAVTAREMTRNMERIRAMAADPRFEGDPEMLREMDRLRLHWEEMAEDMEGAAAAMERIQQRLQTGP